VTPYRAIARAEGLAWFRHPPLPQADDVLIYDKIAQYRDGGRRVVVGTEDSLAGDVDLVLDWPILAREPGELDLVRALEWWREPVRVSRSQVLAVYEDRTGPRVLAVRGGGSHKARVFGREVARSRPEARVVTYRPQLFYWPALELIALADEVVGEAQVQREFEVLRGKGEAGGARRAAGQIRALLGGRQK